MSDISRAAQGLKGMAPGEKPGDDTIAATAFAIHLARTRRRRLVILAAIVVGGIAAIIILRHDPAISYGPPPFLRDQTFDDSGYTTALFFARPVENPHSFDHIRDSFQGLGLRGSRDAEQRLAQGVAAGEELELLVVKAQMYLYEGDFAQAAAILEEVRARAEADPQRFQKGLPTLIFLQGMTALRRGETENCIECQGVASCIFPIQPGAVHQRPDGSRQAIRYFTEYLQRDPGDLGARWLLNLAYMTLGEYPDRVPTQHLIPLATFQSEFDIGRFVDVASQLGVTRLNQAGGAIMDDFDNDGLLDLVVTSWDEATPMAIYRNRGDGTFEERAKAAGLDQQFGGLYCVQTDYNNDGWLDIYVPRGAWKKGRMRHSLLRSNGDGTFTDVTKEAGLLTTVPSQTAAWADYDNDGWLDLFLGGELLRVGGLDVPQRSLLFHNRGDGTFEEVAFKAGVANDGAMCKGANWGDLDGDGFPDLFVSNHNGPCRLFRSNRDGTFTDVAPQLGVTRPHTGFSCWFWDYDNDGWLDIFVTSYSLANALSDVVKSNLGLPHAMEPCRLYRNVGGKRFEDVTAAVGLNLALSPMGSNFVDVDNDGFLDFYLATGGPKYSLLIPNRLFKNVQGQRFADITTSSGTGHLQKGHAVACGDWDRDGDVDLYVQLGGATPGDRFRNVLFQNPGCDHHWITVKLIGKKTNRAAIGARIKAVSASGQTNYRHVTSGSSFGANTLYQTIGLGKAERIARLEIWWPASNTTQVFEDVAVDQAIEITEFEGEYRPLNWSRIPFRSASPARSASEAAR
jgi:hypothetical protein